MCVCMCVCVCVCVCVCAQENELAVRQKAAMGVGRLDAEVKGLRRENTELRQYILALQSEVYGARLAAKYLDKELAGR